MRKSLPVVILVLLLSCSKDELVDPVKVSISDPELLSAYVNELDLAGIPYQNKQDGGVYISETTLPEAKKHGKTVYVRYFQRDVAASYSKFMLNEVESSLISEDVAYKKVCFFSSVYIMWSLSDLPKIKLAENLATQKMHDI